MKSNTAILAQCLAALTKTQLRRLVRHVGKRSPILNSKTEWLVGDAADIAVWAVTDTRPRTGPQMEGLVRRICSVWDKFYAVHNGCDRVFANSTPRQVQMAIRRAAKVKGIEVWTRSPLPARS